MTLCVSAQRPGTDELFPALRKINPKLPETAFTEAVYKLRNFGAVQYCKKTSNFLKRSRFKKLKTKKITSKIDW
jgi:hypothetical protein